MTVVKKCHDHLESAKEGYFEHLFFALGFAGKLFYASFAVFVHALIPAFFQFTGSSIITKLHAELQERLKQYHEHSH